MPDYGVPFTKPPISPNVYPGSWSPLNDKSPLIVSAIEFTLEYLNKTLNYKMPDNLQVQLFTAGTQVVSGLNIYLELRIKGEETWDVQTILHDPAVIRIHNGAPSKAGIHKIYATTKRLF